MTRRKKQRRCLITLPLFVLIVFHLFHDLHFLTNESQALWPQNAERPVQPAEGIQQLVLLQHRISDLQILPGA